MSGQHAPPPPPHPWADLRGGGCDLVAHALLPQCPWGLWRAGCCTPSGLCRHGAIPRAPLDGFGAVHLCLMSGRSGCVFLGGGIRTSEAVRQVAKAVGGGYCRLQMRLKLALAARGTVARGIGRAPWRGLGWGVPPPLPMHRWGMGFSAPGPSGFSWRLLWASR